MHCVAIQHTTHPTPSDSVMQESAVSGLSHVIAPRGIDLSVQLKIDRSMNVQFKQLTKKSTQQNEGHLPLVPHGTNQRNKHLYLFLFSSTDHIWNHLPKHPDKPALPQHTKIIIRLKPKKHLRIYNDMYSQLQILYHRASTHNSSCLKRINLQNET